jgi:soluble lytic murein transglycosylase
MKTPSRFCAMLCSLICCLACASELDEQRYHYEMAKSELKLGNLDAFASHYSQLDDYPLKIYLDYGLATHHLDNAQYSATESFINSHEGSYLGDRLYLRYLHTLAKNHREKDLFYWYKAKHSTTEVTCVWLEARINRGDISAYAEVENIWNRPHSQPKQCDAVFTLWLKSDAFNTHTVWNRFIRSLESKQRGLARYLASLLPDVYQYHVKLAWALDSRPHQIRNIRRFSDATAINRDLIRFGVHRLSHKHPSEALSTWQLYEAMLDFPETDLKEIKTRLLKQLIRHDHLDQAKDILVQSPSIRGKGTTERLIREFLREKRWQDVLFAIHLLPENIQSTDRWQYWQTRARAALGEATDIEVRPTYETLAQNRSFYGFLAADILNKRYSFVHESGKFEKSTALALSDIPAVRRSKELWLQGHLSEARAEWAYATRTLSSKELSIAGALAHSWGWHEGAIRAMIAGEHWNHLDERFPLAYSNHVQHAASKHKIEPQFIYAIARQESAMSPSAKSSVGARGIMQLMPSTARQTANKYGLRHKTTDLYQPEHNIALGTAYLSELLSKYNGNRILAAAAYNAGPYRVEHWLNNTGPKLDFDIWIETIPFSETRRYVKNVLTFSVIYSYRMGVRGALVSDSEAKLKL